MWRDRPRMQRKALIRGKSNACESGIINRDEGDERDGERRSSFRKSCQGHDYPESIARSCKSLFTLTPGRDNLPLIQKPRLLHSVYGSQ